MQYIQQCEDGRTEWTEWMELMLLAEVVERVFCSLSLSVCM